MKKLIMTSLAAVVASAVFADEASVNEEQINSYVGIGVAAPIQYPSVSDNVYGFRFGLFTAYNNEVVGFDLTPVGIADSSVKGVQLGLFTWSNDSVYGLQLGALANVAVENALAFQLGAVNIVRGDAGGFQLSLANYANSFTGVQFGGLFNWNRAASSGAQFGFVNSDLEEFSGVSIGAMNSGGNFAGCQIGAFNFADNMTGLQVGFINAAGDMKGVQIGVFNMICDHRVPVLPVANGSF